MQVVERKQSDDTIVYYVECLLNEGEPASQYLMVECVNKAQAIQLAKQFNNANDIYTEERPNE